MSAYDITGVLRTAYRPLVYCVWKYDFKKDSSHRPSVCSLLSFTTFLCKDNLCAGIYCFSTSELHDLYFKKFRNQEFKNNPTLYLHTCYSIWFDQHSLSKISCYGNLFYHYMDTLSQVKVEICRFKNQII